MKSFSNINLRPEDSKKSANHLLEVLNASIPYEPDQIRNLTKHITDKIASLKNINKIVDETKNDQARANECKKIAEAKKAESVEVERKANELVDGVKTTLEAHDKAKDVITKANDNIKMINNDLTQITSEISRAELKANDTQNEVQELQSRLKKLQTGVLKNEHDAKLASEAGKNVSNQVKVASSQADDLIDKYNKLNEDLKNKTHIYETSKYKALRLFEKAQLLSGSAKAKLKELKEFTSSYEEQEKNLTEFSKDIDELLLKMSDSTKYIRTNSDKYRQCNY